MTNQITVRAAGKLLKQVQNLREEGRQCITALDHWVSAIGMPNVDSLTISDAIDELSADIEAAGDAAELIAAAIAGFAERYDTPEINNILYQCEDIVTNIWALRDRAQRTTSEAYDLMGE